MVIPNMFSIYSGHSLGTLSVNHAINNSHSQADPPRRRRSYILALNSTSLLSPCFFNNLLSNFPVGFRGRLFTNVTPPRNFLYPAACLATRALISSATVSKSPIGTPGFGTTNARGTSVASDSSQADVTPTSWTSGWRPIISSSSVGETWKLFNRSDKGDEYRGMNCIPFVFDHIFDSVDNDEIAVDIEVANVAGAIPAWH